MKRCKHCSNEATFDYSGKDGDSHEKNKYDIMNGKPHSFKGIWKEDNMGICTRFQDAGKQYDEKQGFFFCDEERNKECSYYEPLSETTPSKKKVEHNSD